MLYMPRGTVHAATAQAADSAHLTISTYQRWSAADLLQVGVGVGRGRAGYLAREWVAVFGC